MKRWIPTVLALLVVQALMLAGWWLVEHEGGPADPTPEPTVAFERTSGPAPELEFTRRDASTDVLSVEAEKVVVHFWATWCPPCREELPSLLRWADRSGVSLLAVSVDPTWDAVDRFLPGTVPSTVVLADPEAARRWSAHGLPTTFVVEHGSLVWVARGPVDWNGPGPTLR